MKAKSPLFGAALAMALALALAGCGGGTGSDNPAGGAPVATTGQPDSFFSQVLAIIATSSDTTEPVSTDALTATAPETTEPSLLM